MKFGMRRPSFKGRLSARTSIKRVVRHSVGLKAPRGFGALFNPQKAFYNFIYRRTTFSIFDLFKLGSASKRASGQTAAAPRQQEAVRSSNTTSSFHSGSAQQAPGTGTLQQSGYLRGRFMGDYVEEVKQLKREGRYEEAEKLLLELVATAEDHARKTGLQPASWYHHHLGIVYRKMKRLDKSEEIKKRFDDLLAEYEAMHKRRG